MNVLESYDNRYLKAEDLNGKAHVVEIVRVELADFGKGQKRTVIVTNQFPKGIALNFSSARRIAKLYGQEDTDWLGEFVTIFPTEVEDTDRELVPCIRVRAQAPAIRPARSVTSVASTPPAKNRKKRSTDEVNDK